MAQDPIFQKLLMRLSDFVPTEGLQPETRLKEDLGLDSMELVRLVLALNQDFGIQIQSTEIVPEHFASLHSLMVFIRSKQED